MFTGIIEEIGSIRQIKRGGQTLALMINAKLVTGDLKLGDSIAVNGVSLTISDCDAAGSWFTVAVIPHTYTHTNLSELKPDDSVNLETDILGKYVAKSIGNVPQHRSPGRESITADFLIANGYK